MKNIFQNLLHTYTKGKQQEELAHEPQVIAGKVQVLVLDIGTDSVKALVCVIDHEEGKVEVKGVGKASQKMGDMYNGGVIDIEQVTFNSSHAIAEAEAMAKMKPVQLVIGIAGELVKGTTNTVEYVREHPVEKIILAELKNLLQKVQWRAYEKARREIAFETGYPEVETKLVHSSIVDVRIDGYRVSNPIGFKGKHMVMSIFNSFAPLVHYESLVSVSDNLNKELLSIIVEPFAVAHCRDMEEGGDTSSIYIDIGGGSTDIALVINGGVVGTKMFAIGGRVFTKRLAKHFHIPFLDAEKMKIEFSEGKLKGKKEEEVREILKADVTTWLESLHHALLTFEVTEYFPSRLYLSGGGSMLKELFDELEKANWYRGLKFMKRPKIAYLKPESIRRVKDMTGKIKDARDITPLALANIAFDLAGEDRVLTRVLKQVTRVIST